jgi:C1A family cysteine protease
MTRNYGWIRSSGNLNVPTFQSSSTLQALAANNTSNEYVISNTIPVFDQLTLSSCIANSCCAALMILMQLGTGSFVTLSRLMLYWNLRVPESATGKDAGGFIHDAFNSLQTLGVCEESLWPYDASQVFSQPPLQAYREANSNTITAFYEITSQMDQRLADIELAIRANHPVCFGTTVGQEYENYNGDPNMVFSPPSDSLGGHAQVIVGVRTNSNGGKEFLVRNSWSSSWGINGCAWFSSDYIAWGDTDDIFVPTQMPNLLT